MANTIGSDIRLDTVLAILPTGLDPEARELIERYCAHRRTGGATIRELLDEHPLKASIEINIYIAKYDPAHRARFEQGYLPGRIAHFVGGVLNAFYKALAVAELRTAGDPFTALDDFAAKEVPRPD